MPVVIGIVIGVGSSYWLSRLMANLLLGVTARDPITYVVSVAALVIAAAIACYLRCLRKLWGARREKGSAAIGAVRH